MFFSYVLLGLVEAKLLFRIIHFWDPRAQREDACLLELLAKTWKTLTVYRRLGSIFGKNAEVETSSSHFTNNTRNDTTVDAFDTFVCKNGAGNHILGAVFVELETIVIYKVYRDLLAAFQS
ncbi:hypothetical protein HID58_034121 [Brassica napus]|uniref:HVA22-like protein n=1 Tax=Brassica napus TaxID=3708 RepID=A0ABQ8C159_BRANA|nr:hypothetical protein HID58_034121 [Brassica napus]